MPARKKPTRNLNTNKEMSSVASQTTDELINAPSNELMKKSFTGEKRSAREKKANTKVPAINPSMTAEVTRLTAYWLRCNVCFSSGSTALPTNQSDVPANCESTITGNIFFV